MTTSRLSLASFLSLGLALAACNDSDSTGTGGAASTSSTSTTTSITTTTGTSTTVSTGTGTCQATTDSCGQCLANSATCRGAYCDCVGDASCKNFTYCRSQCADGDEGCNDNCELQYGAGLSKSLQLLSCSDSGCATECGGPFNFGPCYKCAFTSCSAELDACAQDTSCNQVLDCVSQCKDSTCDQGCRSNVQTLDKYNALQTCVQQDCNAACTGQVGIGQGSSSSSSSVATGTGGAASSSSANSGTGGASSSSATTGTATASSSSGSALAGLVSGAGGSSSSSTTASGVGGLLGGL